MLEYIDHIDNSVANPSRIKDGYFVTSFEPGYGVQYTDEAVAEYDFANGRFWKSDKSETCTGSPEDLNVPSTDVIPGKIEGSHQ